MHDITQDALALAGLRQFLLQPRSAQTLELLLLGEIGGLEGIEVEERYGLVPVIRFQLRDHQDKAVICICNPAGFALLRVIIVCGQSVFVDHTGGRPYVKVFGRKQKSAGTIFARLLGGAEAEEDYTYTNGDTLDLTFANITFRRNNIRTASGTPESYGEVLSAAAGASDGLFPGEPEAKVRAAKALWDAVQDRIEEERAEVLAA
ncbi:UNVERIFIED_ORG: hypothetical protein J2W74_002023 [Methylorubrum zatmanii]